VKETLARLICALNAAEQPVGVTDSEVKVILDVILIAVLVGAAATLIIGGVAGTKTFFTMREMQKSIRKGEFERIVRNRDRYESTLVTEPGKSYCLMMLCVSYAQLNNAEEAKKYCERVEYQKLLLQKYFVLAAFALDKSDTETYNTYRVLLEQEPESEEKQKYLKILDTAQKEELTEEEREFIASNGVFIKKPEKSQ